MLERSKSLGNLSKSGRCNSPQLDITITPHPTPHNPRPHTHTSTPTHPHPLTCTPTHPHPHTYTPTHPHQHTHTQTPRPTLMKPLKLWRPHQGREKMEWVYGNPWQEQGPRYKGLRLQGTTTDRHLRHSMTTCRKGHKVLSIVHSRLLL